MLNNSHKTDPKRTRDLSSHRVPQVADQPCPQEVTDQQTEMLSDLAAFKVFMKNNLKPEPAPAGLLSDIRDRIDKIKAAK